MGLVWTEGFETHTNSGQVGRKYASSSGIFATQTGRVFGNAGSINASVYISQSFATGLADTVGIAFGLRLNAQVSGLNSGSQGIYIERGSAEQIHLEVVSNAGSFELRVMRGATQLGVTSEAFAYAAWHHFELKATLHTSTGAFELRHNEVNVLSASGVNTAGSGSNQADIFALRFTTISANCQFDDFAVWSSAGGVSPTDFIGDCVVEGVTPNANGTTIQWTNDAGSGLNFQNVDDAGVSAPDDTGVGGTNSSDTNGQKDLYAYSDLTQINGTIIGVAVYTQLAMASSGSRQVKLRFRDDGGAEGDGTTHTVVLTTFVEKIDMLNLNPATAAAWDVTDINGGEFGVEVVS